MSKKNGPKTSYCFFIIFSGFYDKNKWIFGIFQIFLFSNHVLFEETKINSGFMKTRFLKPSDELIIVR